MVDEAGQALHATDVVPEFVEFVSSGGVSDNEEGL
jgi:hypothetical protein